MSRAALYKRIFSLAGVVPLGFFLLEHTWANASALRGQEAYTATVTSLARVPLVIVVEILMIYVPLAYHAIYGLWMMREGVPEGASPYRNRALSITNRGAAVIALVFIVWHTWELRIHAWRHGLAPHAFYSTLVWHLSSTWHGFPMLAVLYLLGVTATVFHFACSAWAYGVTSGWFASERQKTRAAYGFIAFGAILFIASASTVISLANGLHFTTLHGEGAAQPSASCAPSK